MITNYTGSPQRLESKCPICQSEAISLFVDENHVSRSSVTWCIYGHVTVQDCGNEPKKVYDFGDNL